MCLITFAYRRASQWPLIVLANRDEFHGRPSRACQWWEQAPVLAGRDLQAGGTWLGVSAGGRFAAVTNYREVPRREGPRSRGELPLEFLNNEQAAADYASDVLARGGEYGGFNLLLFDGRRCVLVSNRLAEVVFVEGGVHAISNGGLDTDWPKVARTRGALEAALANDRLDEESLLPILQDERPAAPDELPDTGVGAEMEQFLSPPFIRGESYGTRASTLLWLGRDRGELVEHRYGAAGIPLGRTRIAFELEGSPTAP